jgi:hypothetical protein
MGYRETFFKNTPSINGMYRCVKCGKYFPKSEIDVDHKISKRLGGTDQLYNLQATCKTCNRSKRERSTSIDIASSCIGAAMNGDLGDLAKGVAKQKVKDVLGIKYKR